MLLSSKFFEHKKQCTLDIPVATSLSHDESRGLSFLSIQSRVKEHIVLLAILKLNEL